LAASTPVHGVKKHTCMTVLMRPPMPAFARHGIGVDGVDLRLLQPQELLLHFVAAARPRHVPVDTAH
jgi:hypothetical protein